MPEDYISNMEVFAALFEAYGEFKEAHISAGTISAQKFAGFEQRFFRNTPNVVEHAPFEEPLFRPAFTETRRRAAAEAPPLPPPPPPVPPQALNFEDMPELSFYLRDMNRTISPWRLNDGDVVYLKPNGLIFIVPAGNDYEIGADWRQVWPVKGAK